MSYRSKRTRAEMMETDVPAVTNSSSLTKPLTDTSVAEERWGPFCPKKTEVPAVIKPRQQPMLNDYHLGANIDESYAAKAPISKTQDNTTVEKSPNDSGLRTHLSQTFEKHNGVGVKSTDAFKKTGEKVHVGVKPANSLWRSYTGESGQSMLLQSTHVPRNAGDLIAKKHHDISARKLDAFKKVGEHAQVGVKPTNSLWKSSTVGSARSTLLPHIHAQRNAGDLSTRKPQDFSAKNHDANKKTGEQAQDGVKPTNSLWKSSTVESGRSTLLSNTHAPGKAGDLFARKPQDFSAKNHGTNKKTEEQAQVGIKPTNSLWKSSTVESGRSTLLSNTHTPGNAGDLTARKPQDSSVKQLDAYKKTEEVAQVRVKPTDSFWKSTTVESDRSTLLPNTQAPKTTNDRCTLLSKTHATQNMCQPATRTVGDRYAKQSDASSKKGKDAQGIDSSTEEHVFNQQDIIHTSLNTFKPRRRTAVQDWPDNVEFDESEEVLTIDIEGNVKKVNDPIQPHDVWCAKDVRYCVTFNELHQPLKKGGHILVRFIGDMARKERFCPIRNTNWHHVPEKFKVDIVKVVREHFVLPDGDGYDEGILKRVGKSVRQYRHYLKKTFFKPTSKTREEIYQARPSAIPLDSWIHLVDYWYSEKGKKFAECGKEARASQNHVHTTGSTSYANIRAEFEEKNKREPSELEVFKQTHKRKDGSYVKDTVTEEFVSDADTYIQSEVATNPTKSKVQIQNEAFSKLMYGEEVPKRPLGYGFGVKRSEVFGVHGILRKEASKSGYSSSLTLQNMEKMQHMENAVVNLTKDNKELENKLNETNYMLSKILEGMSSGKPSPELAELAKSILNKQGT